ncbi:MAG: rhomboid family intramembrane serine protease [Candidatus Bathyarchaeota archaeon]|nr:rhomboid family intramembrane serine protease [Candidatus Bathyarchaeum tardum]WGM90344.1 MAG: rhomboid family intramembrane serine protease [Candidatus Bathyarchaeum tardum]WNZ29578.1 MAG: rhomboid family intramembrane serine protease [Candidatus Bathyarchaeota archaeon]
MNKTNVLILFCILSSLTVWFIGDQTLLNNLVFSGENLQKGMIWTVITGIFLHADIFHLGGNMIFFYIFGNTIENELEQKWVIIPFFCGGIGAFLFSLFYYPPNVQMLGASAAIFTLTAIVMLLKPLKFSFIFLMPLGLVAIMYFFFNIIEFYYGTQGNISYIGHLIGFIIGVPFGIASSKQWQKNLIITIGLFTIYLIIVYVLYPTLVNIF